MLSLHNIFLSQVFLYIYPFFCTRSYHKSIRTKINIDYRWNTCIIAHIHKQSRFRPKATGLCDLSLGKHEQRPTCARVSEHSTKYRRAGLVSVVSSLLSPACSHRALTLISASWPLSVSLQSPARQCSGSHAAVGLPDVNCPQDRWWGSKWSSPPSPSPWQHLDSPAGTRCWPARGIDPWSPKGGRGHFDTRNVRHSETLSVPVSRWLICLRCLHRWDIEKGFEKVVYFV